jgi:hypothetical protein
MKYPSQSPDDKHPGTPLIARDRSKAQEPPRISNVMSALRWGIYGDPCGSGSSPIRSFTALWKRCLQEFSILDPGRETRPQEVGNFGLGLGQIMVNLAMLES